MPMNLVNGVECDSIDVTDRALAYGDGVFRTFTLCGGCPVTWAMQHGKLAADCAALRIPCPDAVLLEHDLSLIAARFPDCVIRIIVTRGSGPRGYAIPPGLSATRVISAGPLPNYPRQHSEHGIRARLCVTQLACQPALAGIKHLNRLENVLARSEWSDPDIAEGLMCDSNGNVIGGTMSNLFLVRAGALLTPALERCGVAGVTRQRVLDFARANGVPAHITNISIGEVRAADEMFLVNSVIGVWPVTAFEQTNWSVGRLTSRIRNGLLDGRRH